MAASPAILHRAPVIEQPPSGVWFNATQAMGCGGQDCAVICTGLARLAGQPG